MGDYNSKRIGPSGHIWLEIAVPHLKTFPQPRVRHALEWMARAREACVVWHILASCKGFSGLENERFWKRLIDAVARRFPDVPKASRSFIYDSSDESSLSPTLPTVTGLPRFQLMFLNDITARDESDNDEEIESFESWVSAAIRAFVDIHDTTAGGNSAVQGYVTLLLPHADETKVFEHAIEICFRMIDSVPRPNFTNSVLALSAEAETRRRESTPAQRKSDLLAGIIRFPIVTFKEFKLMLVSSIERDDMVAELLQIIATAGNGVTLSSGVLEPIRDRMSEDTLSAVMEALQRTSSRTLAPVQWLEFFIGEASRRQREIIFSSFPTTSIPIISVGGADTGQTMTEHDWAWFAYGVYHPWSQFSKLDMTELDISERSASAMKSIPSAHASLYRLYYGEEDDSVLPENLTDREDAHYTVVTVCAGTTCYESALLQGKRLCELNDETALTAVVKYAMREVDQLPTVVCVVVPTRGYGWIHYTSISRLSWLPAPGASIHHIGFSTPEENPSMPIPSIGPLFRNVASLDLQCWPELSASRLLELLRACPRLKRLHVHHFGDLWHDWDETTAGGDSALNNLQLQALTLLCYDTERSFRAPSKTAWNTCLRHLSSFHISTSNSTDVNRETVRDAFQQGYTVEKFVWSSRSRFGSAKEATYEEGRTNTRKLLQITKGKNDKAQLPFSVEARLAFASVIKRKAKDDGGEARRLRPRRDKQRFEGLGKLSQDIARLICEFATTDVERRAWVYC